MVRRFIAYVTGIAQRRRADREAVEELQFHLEQETGANIQRGLSPQEARRQAHLDLGGVAQTAEGVSDVRTLWVDGVWRDIRYAIRTLKRSPLFTISAAGTLALGIGANTGVFTVVNAVLFGSLPFEQPERITWLNTRDLRGRELGVSRQDFEDWRRSTRTFSALALGFRPGLTLADDNGLPVQYPGGYLSGVGFNILGAHAALGRVFHEDDDRPGAAPVVVLGSGLWKDRYGGDPNILGKVVRINSVPATVIGVMPDWFAFPGDDQVWVPMSLFPPALLRGRQNRFYYAYGRLTEGVTVGQARTDLTSISTQLAKQYPDTSADTLATLTSFPEAAVDPQIRTLSWALLGAVAFVLLIACANVANLLLARSATRAREIALRASLGATRGQIVRQLLVESLILSCLGGGLGLGLAILGIQWADVNTPRPLWMRFAIDVRVLTFFAGVCLVTTVLFGLAPALQLAKASTSDALKEGDRTGINSRRTRRWAGALVVTELTLTLVLLSGAGFTIRSFLALYRLDIGVDTSRLLTMRVVLPARKYATKGQVMAFLQRVDEQLNTVPTVEAASTTTSLPLFALDARPIAIEGQDPGNEGPPTVPMLSIGSRYFETLGVGLVRGRAFAARDGEPGREVAVINQRFATLYFPDADPIGKRIRFADRTPAGEPYPWATIVGVSPPIRQRSLQMAPEVDPVVYIPNIQHLSHRNGTLILVRARSDPAQLTPQIRQEIFAIDPDLPLSSVDTMDQVLAGQRWSSRVYGTMFGVFALVALVLAGGGLYAVIAYAVTQRTSEIGLRRALGAQPRHIAWLVVRRAVWQVVIGLSAGLAGAIAVGRLLRTVLVETAPTDAVTLLLTASILVIVATFACYMPTRRAVHLDPLVALRHE